MIKNLVVGDMHVVRGEVDECADLISFIVGLADQHNVDNIVFMGDQFNNHAILDSYVVDFWLDTLSSICRPVIMLTGNHDMANSKSVFPTHALRVFNALHNVTVVDHAYSDMGLLYVPYIYQKEHFLERVGHHTSGSIYCHQEFNGGIFENGFKIKDGVDLESLSDNVDIISGHIHKGGMVGKLHYVGSPRWRSISDANQEKGVWIITHKNSGRVADRQFFSTASVCKSIVILEDRQGKQADLSQVANSNVTVDVYGTKAYVDNRKKELANKGVRIRSFIEQERAIRVKESDGVYLAFSKFVDSYVPIYGSNKEDLLKLTADRIKF